MSGTRNLIIVPQSGTIKSQNLNQVFKTDEIITKSRVIFILNQIFST